MSYPQALTPPIPLYPPNAGPVLPGLLSSAALGASSNVAAVAAAATAAAQQACERCVHERVREISFLGECVLLS